jgi:hypothetical protein
MLSAVEVITIIVFSYFATALEMVSLHSEDFDPPSYIYKPAATQILYASIWPVVSHVNDQLGWFFIVYISTCIVYGAAYLALDGLTHSLLIPIIIIAIIRFTPLTFILSIPIALIGAIIWLFTGGPLGWKMAKHQ